ncbi:ammonia channel protein [candidate division WOR-1 bacterium RIFOXYB2_FULL_42_35]|uniref:Ammonium transporter n=1 Tax=candidate division WOR-1 bacterium RIFOXYC2_FULL_41_25 TaxID=1802586 RepID=A0A1F4TRJ1_UNCSA|nr:MAG: ammonia channel protein [candidate division WOR-1 bacterium RIFOXYA2_FULL_41_14]OGC25762.1 MAG: ammonia channel protein [candidate division WOR-1 bacterium RIFOXYB2_FULL_42_35]OGC35364.1 MAG: ammonia channel protein [candidate division WOR-1 bacterium RIFOXYC2_FULL_41_25]OGC43527.1 MAG: ammonia channel protein [candidate division WOR-1 bacterium RIFOXYD2_FULL_41_8]
MSSGDTAWVLISTALVVLMTPAVGFFYGGMVRRKSILSTLMMCFAALFLISIQWVLIGYTLAFGPSQGGLIGGLSWLGLNGVGQLPNPAYAATIPALCFMMFQAAFAIITPSLIVGAIVERIKFAAFLIFTVLWSTLVYDPVAHWVWGVGGWLRTMGALDFAGGTVVHITAGFSALAIALVLGKRIGYGKDNMEPSNIPFVFLGAILLWFGWFGFNGGSALAANGLAVQAFVVTNTSGAAAAIVWMILSWLHRRPSVLGVATGAVVGLAAITPASGFVSPMSAILIGGVAAAISYYIILFRMKLRIDESLDVFACHGMGSFWGIIATGLFASLAINPAGANGFFHGNPGLVLIQLFAAVVVAAFSFVVTYVLATLIDLLVGLRVTANEELVGLDISQHAETV